MLGCIPSPKFRVIHRSLLFEAIQEQKRGLLTETLEALKAAEETNTKQEAAEPPKDTVDENGKEQKDGNSEPTIKEEEETNSESVSKIVDALQKLEEVHREQNENLVEANENGELQKQLAVLNKTKTCLSFPCWAATSSNGA